MGSLIADCRREPRETTEIHVVRQEVRVQVIGVQDRERPDIGPSRALSPNGGQAEKQPEKFSPKKGAARDHQEFSLAASCPLLGQDAVLCILFNKI